jgi:hypothetical protein
MTTVTNCPHCGGAVAIMKAPITPAQPSAPAATAKPSTPHTSQKTQAPLNLVTCNRCGEGDLCWQEGKSGKFYLCRAQMDGNGQLVPLRKEFHTCRQ